jgi:hypothetical protein
MRSSNISNNMTSIGTMVIGDENRTRQLHGQYYHSTSIIHSPRPSMIGVHSGNSIFIMK